MTYFDKEQFRNMIVTNSVDKKMYSSEEQLDQMFS